MRFIYHHRVASKDGQSTHIEEVISAMRNRGHVCIVCSPKFHEKDSGTGGSAGWVGILKKSLPAAIYELIESAYILVSFFRLLRSAVVNRPDFIYERYALFNLAGVWVSKLLKIPLIMEINTPYSESRATYNGLKLKTMARWIEVRTWCGADAVLPVSQVMADLIAEVGISLSKIHVVPNAINPQDFANLPSQATIKERLGLSEQLVVGFTGYVREWDRLDRILDWMSSTKVLPQVHLLIVGDGPVRLALEQKARLMGLEQRLHFTGVVPRQEVPIYAQAFDIALQTALVPYASPLCLFEYLALGKAIVAPDQPNHHEVLVDQKDCLFYQPNQVASIGACI